MKYVKNKIKQFLSFLLKKLRQFINSRFFLSLIMLAIGSSYTVIYFKAPEAFSTRVTVYANNSNVGSSEQADPRGDEEVEEADDILIDKATKVGPTVNGNIALLDVNNLNGDLYDSGVQLSDLSVDIFDGGMFDNTGEL
jgi:hypothetical protein